jgi:alanyl-tRNA synthetase
MTTLPAYWSDAYRTELETELVELGTDDRGPWVTLADTILYPEGGGQPADHGWIEDVQVHDVQTERGRTVHHVASLETLSPGPVTVRLDWQRRWDHMQQHTAQHLLTAVAADRFGWTTIGFHLGDQVSDIDLDTPEIEVEQLRKLEDAVAAATRAGRAVVAHWATPAELEEIGARCRALPDDVPDTVRLIDIEGIDFATCGGTHVRSTAELAPVCLLATERRHGGTRLLYAAGDRARRRLFTHEQRAAQLRELLSCRDDEVIGSIAHRSRQLAEAERRAKRLGSDLVDALVAQLAAHASTVVHHHLPEHAADLLSLIARRYAERGQSGVLLLTSDAGTFAVVTSADIDSAALGRTVAEILDGRGGGRPPVFQGKATRIRRATEAVERLRELVAGHAR